MADTDVAEALVANTLAPMTPAQVAEALGDVIFTVERLDHLRPSGWRRPRRIAFIRTLRWALEDQPDVLTGEYPPDDIGRYFVEHYNRIDADQFINRNSQIALGRWLHEHIPMARALGRGEPVAMPKEAMDAILARANEVKVEPDANPWVLGAHFIVQEAGDRHGWGLAAGSDVYFAGDYGDYPDRAYFNTRQDAALRGTWEGYLGRNVVLPGDPALLARMKAEKEAQEKADAEAAAKAPPFSVGGIARHKRDGLHYRLIFDYRNADEHYGARTRRQYDGRAVWEVDQIDKKTKRSVANHSTQIEESSLEMLEAGTPMVWPTIESMSANDPDDVDGLREALRQARQDHLDDIADLSKGLSEWAVKAGYCPTYDARMIDSAIGMKVPLAPRNSTHLVNAVDRYVVEVPRRLEIQAANMTAAIAAVKAQDTRFAPDLSTEIVGRLVKNLTNVRDGVKVARTGDVDAVPAT